MNKTAFILLSTLMLVGCGGSTAPQSATNVTETEIAGTDNTDTNFSETDLSESAVAGTLATVALVAGDHAGLY
jgi:PBP1b-binding outer membrane lipoprotein LpoB